MSKVVTRTATSTANNGPRQRAAPYPSNYQAPPANNSNYTSRRAPAPQDYRIDFIEQNGVRTEVLTIEDTPPRAGPSRSNNQLATASTSRTQNDSSQPKKRKSDGAHIGDQPYARKRKTEQDSVNSQTRHESGSSREAASSRAKEPLPVDDKEGHFIVRVGDTLMRRYEILRPLGQGTFGKVVCARDNETGRDVAVKIIRAIPKYREASKVEIKVLNFLQEHDPENKYHCIHLIEFFDYQNHICLVSELLSSSVFDFLKENSYNPFPFSHIQSFAQQLLKSVAFLHSINLIHTDLKPENILLADSRYWNAPPKSTRAPGKSKRILNNPDIRLIDFGSATFDNEYHATVVSTRHYRAPEIILGLGWSFPCDAWSIGCILIEFYTGEALFQTHENLEHLAMMKEVFGDMPPSYLKRAAAAKDEWFRDVPVTRDQKVRGLKTLNYPNSTATRHSKKFVTSMKKLEDIVSATTIGNQRFLDLLSKLLKWDPAQRIRPEEALSHPFFNVKFDDDGNRNAIDR